MSIYKKRVDFVKIKIVKESSISYTPRRISCPADVVFLLQSFLDDTDRECFVVVALDAKNQPTAIELCSIGILNASLVHPREVFKMAVLSNAHSIIVAHNHPSGDVAPSKADIDITRKLVSSGEILGIEVKDHLIIGGSCDAYLSFEEHKLMR